MSGTTIGNASENEDNVTTEKLPGLAALEALIARVRADEVRLAQTRIVAPDDGVISARWATEGAMAQPGQELFRLIRRGRLEWRAEVPSGDMVRLKPGMEASSVHTHVYTLLKGTKLDPPTAAAVASPGLPPAVVLAGIPAEGALRQGADVRITVPAPVWDYSSARVLTMEMIPGQKVTRISELRRIDPDESLGGVRNSLTQHAQPKANTESQSKPGSRFHRGPLLPLASCLFFICFTQQVHLSGAGWMRSLRK